MKKVKVRGKVFILHKVSGSCRGCYFYDINDNRCASKLSMLELHCVDKKGNDYILKSALSVLNKL